MAILEALTGVLSDLDPPRELSAQSPLASASGLPDPTVVGAGAETLVSLLARGVVLVVATEILLRGFVLPVLSWVREPGGTWKPRNCGPVKSAGRGGGGGGGGSW